MPLVREGSKFWDVGGYTARLGWRGITVEVDSLQTFMTGGVAIAVQQAIVEAERILREAHPMREAKTAIGSSAAPWLSLRARRSCTAQRSAAVRPKVRASILSPFPLLPLVSGLPWGYSCG